MAQAATNHNIEPRTISFMGTLQTLEAFQPLIDFQGHRGSSFRVELFRQLLDSIVRHWVGDRPGQFEPRKRKRRHKWNEILNKRRHEAKLAILKGLSKN